MRTTHQSRSERDRMVEETTAHAVLALLLVEGHGVSDLDRVTEGRGRSPDYLVTIDGERMALEVVRLVDERAAKADAGLCRPFVHPDQPAFVARVILKKGNQHVGHADRAILAVVGESDDAAGLAAAFAASCQPIPWWRVYEVWSGGTARLVYESAA
jgi:hypothetical protein